MNLFPNTNLCNISTTLTTFVLLYQVVLETDSFVLDYHNIKWFALETNRDHSVIFEIASKYCVLDSFVDYDGYFISSKGFLPTVVDIMVI